MSIMQSATLMAVLSLLLTPTQDPDPAAFDRADRRAQTIVTQLLCSREVARLRQRGAFGPADSLGTISQCTIVDGQFVGVIFATDSSLTTVTRLSAVDLTTSTRRSAPIDTGRVLAVLRASRLARARGHDRFKEANRVYTTFNFRFDGDSIEVWHVPAAVLSAPAFTVGGERGYIFSPDGATLVREVDEFATMRFTALPDTGVVTIKSDKENIPSMTELLIANMLNRNGREASIQMPSATAFLVGTGQNAVWMHAASPKPASRSPL